MDGSKFEPMSKPTVKLEHKPIDIPADGLRLAPMYELTEETEYGSIHESIKGNSLPASRW